MDSPAKYLYILYFFLFLGNTNTKKEEAYNLSFPNLSSQAF